MFDRLQFRRIEIHATSLGGPVTAMHIGMLGTMAQMMLADLGDNTWRGQLRRALAGAIPGGLAYGYEVVAAAAVAKEAGGRRIITDEAAIIRRIFEDYVTDRSAPLPKG